jgi:hypothetical protein
MHSIVLDIDKHRSFLLVLDAGSFNELARAAAPHITPSISTAITSQAHKLT